MAKELIVLPGWGIAATALENLVAELQQALPELKIQLQTLPQMTGLTVDAVLEQLDQQLPQDCWLVGWSLGGMLATGLAARRQSGCPGVISYASNACFVARPSWSQAMPAATFSEFYHLCSNDLEAGLKRFALLCSQGAEQPRHLSRMLPAQVMQTDDALAGLNCLANLDNRSAIRDFTGPQLHLLGTVDALVPSSVATDLLALNSQAQVGLLGQSHASVVAQPQLLAQRIASFMVGEQHA